MRDARSSCDRRPFASASEEPISDFLVEGCVHEGTLAKFCYSIKQHFASKKLHTHPMSKLSLNDILAANLASLMEKAGYTQASLAKLSGVGKTTISLYLNPARRQPSKSGKVPSAKFGEVEALADVFGVAPWDLLRPEARHVLPSQSAEARNGVFDLDNAEDAFPMRIGGSASPPWEGGETTRQAERGNRISRPLHSASMANVGPGERHAANDKFEQVPELADVRLAAGDGIENHTETQTGVMQFRRSFLRSVGADGGKALVVYAKGDSMEPFISDGAALLVVPNENLSLGDLGAGRIYAINYDGKMIVKKVGKDRLTGKWVAQSFNPSYQDVALENGATVRILGRVVWTGTRLP